MIAKHTAAKINRESLYQSRKPVTISDFCIFIWNLPFCEEKKSANMKNPAKIMNKWEKKPEKK